MKKIRVGGKKVKLTPGLLKNITEARARAQGANAALLRRDVQTCPYTEGKVTSMLIEHWMYGYNIGSGILKQRSRLCV